MSRWMPLLAAVATLCSVACNPCQSTTVPLVQADGGAVRCVAAEDCPRVGTDIVCVTNSPLDFTSTCVACVATVCQRTEVSCP